MMALTLNKRIYKEDKGRRKRPKKVSCKTVCIENKELSFNVGL